MQSPHVSETHGVCSPPNPSSPPFLEPSRTLSCVVNYCFSMCPRFPQLGGFSVQNILAAHKPAWLTSSRFFFFFLVQSVRAGVTISLLCSWNHHAPRTCPNRTGRSLRLNAVYWGEAGRLKPSALEFRDTGFWKVFGPSSRNGRGDEVGGVAVNGSRWNRAAGGCLRAAR